MNKTKTKSFVSGAGVYLFSNILNAVIPFILLPILTRYLNPAEYGEVAMFQTLLGALGAFVGLVFVGAASRKYYDSDLTEKDLAEFISACIQISFISSLITLLVLLIFQGQFSEWLGLKPIYVLLAVIVGFCSVVIKIRLGQWQVQKKAIKYGVLQISQSFINLIFSLLFVVVFLRGAAGRIDAQVVAALVFLLIALFLLYKDNLLKIFSWRREYIKEALKFGGPLVFHTSGAFLLLTVDRFIINKELGLTEVGIYMVAVQLVSVMNMIFDAVNKAYVPYLYECMKKDDLQEKIKLMKNIYIGFFLIIIVVVLAFLIGPWFVKLFAGEKYAAAGKVIGLLALGQGFKGMYLMVTNFIFYSKKTKVTAQITIVVGLINLGLLVLLVKSYGIVGAASANAISMMLFFIATWYFAAKLVDMPWRLK